MADYSEGKIYLVKFRNDPSLVYVGSTKCPLNERFRKDKYRNTSLYKYIDENCDGNWDDWYIELYEDYPCLNEKELERREGEITRKFKNDDNYKCINKCIAGRTTKEYKKEYYENNKEKILEYQKEYKKEYRENNKEKILEYQKEYQKQKKITCSCGSIIRLDSKSRHLKTQKHLASL
jgi:hypothetical protein